jgi:hypothetical protein
LREREREAAIEERGLWCLSSESGGAVEWFLFIWKTSTLVLQL